MKKEIFELGTFPQVIERIVLDNGLTLFTHKKPGLEGKVSIRLGVNFGARDESDKHLGIAHFIEHTVFRGTDDFSGRMVLTEIEDFGGEWDASTNHETTEFGLDVQEENALDALGILHSVIFQPKFGPRNTEKERSIILQEIADGEHDYDEVVGELFLKTLYQEHPLRRPIVGTRETVSGISRDQLAEHHQRYYVPGNMVLAIVGDFNPEIIERATELFNKVKSRTSPKRQLVPELIQEAGFTETRIRDNNWCSYLLGAKLTNGKRGLSTSHEDYVVVDLINYLLVAGEGSRRRMSGRINEAVRERGAKVYSVGSDYAISRDYSHFTISFSREGSPDEVVDIILHELNKLRKEKITDGELMSIKRFALSGYNDRLTNRGRLAESLLEEAFYRGALGLKDFPPAVQRVTSEDIMRVANQYMNIDDLTIARVVSDSL